MGEFMCVWSYESGWCMGVSQIWHKVYQRYALFWIMVTRSGKSVLVVEQWPGEMSFGPEWKFEVQEVEKERWAISHGWYHVD